MHCCREKQSIQVSLIRVLADLQILESASGGPLSEAAGGAAEMIRRGLTRGPDLLHVAVGPWPAGVSCLMHRDDLRELIQGLGGRLEERFGGEVWWEEPAEQRPNFLRLETHYDLRVL